MDPTTSETDGSATQELTGAGLLLSRCSAWLARARRRLPRLVWPGQEIDVRVTFKDLGALGDGDGWDLLRQADVALRDLGVRFDAGSGCHGRDWEWDWSLSGPISVTFRDHAKNPDLRKAAPRRPKLKLVS